MWFVGIGSEEDSVSAPDDYLAPSRLQVPTVVKHPSPDACLLLLVTKAFPVVQLL